MRGGLRVLSGDDVVSILASFGFVVVGGTKHIKLRRSSAGGPQTLVVPAHSPIAKGTLRVIYSQALRYISEEQLHPLFYND
jgi:predicted RNA binding protein YcfA (HicA-like mRNA interferase family)